MANTCESIENYMADYGGGDPAPTYNDFISISMAHNGIFTKFEDALIAITTAPDTAAKSMKFGTLCIRRYAKTGKFNAVIAGEMALETGQDLETEVTAEGMRFRRVTSYFQRLPWDALGRDGDYIDEVHYRSPRRKQPKDSGPNVT